MKKVLTDKLFSGKTADMTEEEEAKKRLEEFKKAAAEGNVELNCTEDEAREVMETFKTGRKPDFTVTRAEISGAWENERGTGFEISWGTKSAGFGTITLVTDKDGNTHIDDECMSKEFVANVFIKLLTGAYDQKEKDEEND